MNPNSEIICPECGSNCDASATNCPSCGFPLTADSASSSISKESKDGQVYETSSEYYYDKPKRNWKGIAKKVLNAATNIRLWLIICGVGIWCSFVQDHKEYNKRHDVYVSGGTIGKVLEVDSVSKIQCVGSPVDINIYSVNGYRMFYNSPRDGNNNKYFRVPVSL